MNKTELLAAIAAYPDDTEFVVTGYEGSMSPLAVVEATEVEDMMDDDYPYYIGRLLPSPGARKVVVLAAENDRRREKLSAADYRRAKAAGWHDAC